MDLETENRLAALLMEEARRLRREAEKEGVSAYLHQPHVRGRPNARFLTATVLGVQQANRVVEVNEMWRAREKEIELDRKRRHSSADTMTDKSSRDHYHSGPERGRQNSSSSGKRLGEQTCSSEDEGLKDEELENFLQSRVKRGRGAVGSRMDEPGPYPASKLSHQDKEVTNNDFRLQEQWERRVIGPEKPSSLNSFDKFVEDHSVQARDKKERDSKKHCKKHRKKGDTLSKKKTKKKEKEHRHRDRSH